MDMKRNSTKTLTNKDSIIGISFTDLDNNGLVDGSKTLKLINDNQVIDIVEGAKRKPQKNGSQWSASKAIQTDSGYEVLIEGIKGALEDKFKIWTIDSNGKITKKSNWSAANDMMWNGYEEKFDEDINKDSIIGISFTDLDNNGLVDDSKTLKLINDNQVMILILSKEQSVSHKKNGSQWSASKAIKTDSGYDVLIEGKLKEH